MWFRHPFGSATFGECSPVPSARARIGRSLPTSCSCRLIVLVETTVRSPFSRAHTSAGTRRSEEHTSELQSHSDLVCRLLLEKKKKAQIQQKHHKAHADD